MKQEVDLGDRRVTIIGTAHVSEESVETVSETISETRPDLVAVELDDARLESLTDRSGWRDMDISQAIREGKGATLFLNLMLSIYQRRIGMEQGVEPGKEMLAAVEEAESQGVATALIDRDMGETLSRLRSELSLWQKYRLAAGLLVESENVDVEEVKEGQTLQHIVQEMGESFPGLKKVLLDERNRYMAEQIRQRDFDHAVVVVGAAHVEGLKQELETPTEQEKTSQGGWPVLKAVKYGFPLVALATLGLTFFFNQCKFQQVAAIWVGVNAVLAGLGAVIARSHSLTVLASFIAAPFTSLDPAIGAGYVAAYVEANYYPPTVEELEQLPYLTEYRELWQNQAGRILLAFVFVTVGSALATFIGTFAGISAATGAC